MPEPYYLVVSIHQATAPRMPGGQWARVCAELPWGRPGSEARWRRLDLPEELRPWCAEVQALRRPDALLRALLMRGAATGSPDEIVFLPGWSSTLYSWRHALPALAAHHPTWYLETREKASSRLRHGDRLTVADMAADLRAFVDASVTSARYGIIAVSMGAVVALRALAELDVQPSWVVLLAPHLAPPAPGRIRLIRALPDISLQPLRAAMLPAAWWVRRRRAASSLGGSHAILRTGDMAKLRQSLLSWHDDPGLPTADLAALTCPCLVIGAPDDRLHPTSAARTIARLLPSGMYVDGGSFDWAHSPAMVADVLSFVRAVSGEPPVAEVA